MYMGVLCIWMCYAYGFVMYLDVLCRWKCYVIIWMCYEYGCVMYMDVLCVRIAGGGREARRRGG